MSPRLDLAWGHDSGTVEMPAYRRGVPLADALTEPIHLLDLTPPVPSTRPSSRVRTWAYLAAATVGAGIAHLLAVAS